MDNHIFWQDKPRPRVYWYNSADVAEQSKNISTDEENDISLLTLVVQKTFSSPL
ncbi:MAG: hypothetical protein ACPGVO_20800 [Spirulinaceae cyanobacterium]